MQYQCPVLPLTPEMKLVRMNKPFMGSWLLLFGDFTGSIMLFGWDLFPMG